MSLPPAPSSNPPQACICISGTAQTGSLIMVVKRRLLICVQVRQLSLDDVRAQPISFNRDASRHETRAPSSQWRQLAQGMQFPEGFSTHILWSTVPSVDRRLLRRGHTCRAAQSTRNRFTPPARGRYAGVHLHLLRRGFATLAASGRSQKWLSIPTCANLPRRAKERCMRRTRGPTVPQKRFPLTSLK